MAELDFTQPDSYLPYPPPPFPFPCHIRGLGTDACNTAAPSPPEHPASQTYPTTHPSSLCSRIRGLGMEVCTTLGMLTPEQAQQLRTAGLTAYNHNLDTSPGANTLKGGGGGGGGGSVTVGGAGTSSIPPQPAPTHWFSPPALSAHACRVHLRPTG